MRLLVYGDTGGSGGYVRYCKGLFGGRDLATDMEVVFVCATPFYQRLKPLHERVRVIHHAWPASPQRIHRYWWHLVLYPRLVRQLQPDMEFYPSGQLRVYGRGAVTVATCHNLLPFDSIEQARVPEIRTRQKLARYRSRQSLSFRRASGVIFLSQHSREVILRELPAIQQHTVVAHGLDDEFRAVGPRSYQLGAHVKLLYVSSIWPYKHHVEVIKAVREIRQLTGRDVRLRVVGTGSAHQLAQLRELVQTEGARDYVELIGELERAALLEEYQTADLFVFASSCETFGISLLEAMGARLPIACSDRTGLKDILQEAGVYFDPNDPHSIASGLQQLIDSEAVRLRLGEQAFDISKLYTWSRSACATFEFIRQVHAQQSARQVRRSA